MKRTLFWTSMAFLCAYRQETVGTLICVYAAAASLIVWYASARIKDMIQSLEKKP